MDGRQFADDAWTSLRTLWREELWLPPGVGVAALAYVIWIGLTGVAVTFFLEIVAGPVSLDPWTAETSLAVVAGLVLWIVGPAALATVLVVDRLRNVNDNLRHGYRLRHPILLLGPPATVLAVGYGALVQTGTPSLAVLGLLAAGTVWFVIRTAAYAYRVFSLAFPIVADVVVFATAFTFAAATLLSGAVALGREAAATALLSGLAERTGTEALATLLTDTVPVGGVAVPKLAATVVAVPVGLCAGYVGVQVVWSLAMRLWRPTVRRPELRTGQRYPEFARPTTSVRSDDWTPVDDASADGTDETASPGPEHGDPVTDGATNGNGAAAAGAESNDGDGTPDQTEADGEADETADDVTHTRVFTPPDDAALDGDGDRCPSCGDEVPPGTERCPSCGASVDVA